jgi:glycogen(starch) synthase
MAVAERRVLLLIDRFWPTLAGAEVQATRLIRALRPRGYRFLVVTSKLRVLPDRDDFEGTPVRRFPFYVAFEEKDVHAIQQIRRGVSQAVQEFGPELVHLNGFGPTVFFRREACGPGTPLLFEVSGGLPDSISDARSALGQAIRAACWVTAISNAMLERTRQLVPEITPRSSAILYGLPAPDLAPSALPLRPPRILCLGRLLRDKGFDLALDAFARVLAARPDARLTVAGDGEERAALERQAAALGIGRAVEFVGAVASDDVPGLLDASALLVVPSRWEEPFGLVAIEAALLARPVVATRSGALPELVLDGETGRVVPKQDPEALAGAVLELLQCPAAMQRMGQAARERALRAFSLERYADEYDRAYRRALATS